MISSGHFYLVLYVSYNLSPETFNGIYLTGEFGRTSAANDG